MKKTLTTLILTGSLISSQAAISLVSSDDNSQGNTLLYGSTFFSTVAVQAGDVLVLSHATNKRDNGSNTISAVVAGETFTSLAAGNSGGQAGAYVFYSTISTTGSINISFDTTNASKNGSKTNAYYLLRAGAGETISLADSKTAADVAGTSLSLSLDSSAVGGFGVLAAATQTTAMTGLPTGFTEDRSDSGDKRITWSNSAVAAGHLNPTVTIDTADFEAAVGAVFVATVVPEPSSTALLGLGSLALLLRRRK